MKLPNGTFPTIDTKTGNDFGVLDLLNASLPVLVTSGGGHDTRDSWVSDLTAEQMANLATGLLPERISAATSVVAQRDALHEWDASRLDDGIVGIVVCDIISPDLNICWEYI
jgi:hypothetical protein